MQLFLMEMTAICLAPQMSVSISTRIMRSVSTPEAVTKEEMLFISFSPDDIALKRTEPRNI